MDQIGDDRSLREARRVLSQGTSLGDNTSAVRVGMHRTAAEEAGERGL